MQCGVMRSSTPTVSLLSHELARNNGGNKTQFVIWVQMQVIVELNGCQFCFKNQCIKLCCNHDIIWRSCIAGSYSQESKFVDRTRVGNMFQWQKFYYIPWHFHAAKVLNSENSKQDIHHFQFARCYTESNATIAMAEPVQLASIHACSLWWLEWCEILFSLL